MTIYYCLYLLIGIMALIKGNLNGKIVIGAEIENEHIVRNRKFMCWFCFGLLFLLFALRKDTMGIDLNGPVGYIASYESLAQKPWSTILSLKSYYGYERGYIILNKLLSMITSDPRILLITCAFLSLLPVFLLISKYSKSPAFSTVLYMGMPVFHLLYSGLRQDIAIGVCVFSIVFIRDKRIIPFLLCVFIAIAFHTSAFIFIVAYPLFHIRFNKTARIASLVGIGAVYLLREPLFAALSKLFKKGVLASSTGAFTLFVVFVLIYIFCSIYCEDNNIEQNGFLNLFMMACVCQAFSGLYNLSMRVGYYFMIFLIVLLPNVIDNIEEVKNRTAIKIIIGLIFIVYALISIKESSWSMAYPYYWFWE